MLILSLCSASAGTVAVVKQVVGYRCNRGLCFWYDPSPVPLPGCLLGIVNLSLLNLKQNPKQTKGKGKYMIIMPKILPFELVF